MPSCGVDTPVGIDGKITDGRDERRFAGVQFVGKGSRTQRLQCLEVLVDCGGVNVDQSEAPATAPST